ncbi:MAG: TerB family tellurite resistance protein [Paracoccaceae bacterium]|nr:TerB family tellurite resistance protein [Paracoccaceae bacterium]MDG1739332.1 TerB family tellurite resistance protein [Paracoccaceae bacterium]MDG2259424.1 TerB family tellurite resistance protein [Paracoccaceae bacterium]
MFSKFLTSVLSGEPATLPDSDARLALTALMVRIARADEFYDDAEAAHIDRIVMQRYDVTPFEAAELRREAEEAEAKAADTVQFTRAIKDAIPLEDRMAVVEALWAVALADQERDPEEDSLLRLVSNLLGINDRDSALARQRVASK